MSAEFNFNSRQAKLEMASKLPADATLIVFSSWDAAVIRENILRAYEGGNCMANTAGDCVMVNRKYYNIGSERGEAAGYGGLKRSFG